jgi:hypothetical protein
VGVAVRAAVAERPIGLAGRSARRRNRRTAPGWLVVPKLVGLAILVALLGSVGYDALGRLGSGLAALTVIGIPAILFIIGLVVGVALLGITFVLVSAPRFGSFLDSAVYPPD